MNDPSIIVKGEDADGDGKIDYWQHYRNGQPFGGKIWIDKEK